LWEFTEKAKNWRFIEKILKLNTNKYLHMQKPAFRQFNFRKEFKEVIRNVTFKDVALLLILPAVLTLLMLLPDSFRIALQLHLKNPEWWQLFTSSFIHGSWAHLAGNLVGYFFAVFPAFVFAAYAGRKPMYYKMYLAICLGFPLIGGLAELWLIRMSGYYAGAQLSRGSSGIIAALLEIMPFVVINYYSEKKEIFLGNKFLLLASSYVAFALVKTFKLFALEMIILLVIALLVFSYRSDFRILWAEIKKEKKKNTLSWLLPFIILLIYLLLTPYLLSPAISEPVKNGARTDFNVHCLGLIFGILIGSLITDKGKPKRKK
jgi:membrane associated rhomboid family serine protease